ncbi:MAG: hypothetical protein MK193_06730 [Lentisphaeria bacterium]|nr:hypothetical protein [Lentisphaeria bacterium]
MITNIQRWGITIRQQIYYVLGFHIWNANVAEMGLWYSTIILAIVMFIDLKISANKKLFYNRMDLFCHYVVFADFLLEGILRSLTLFKDPWYFDFYFCAIGFTLVISSYRLYIIKEMKKNQKQLIK